MREIYTLYYERVYIIKKRRGYGTDRRSYENSEKGVARNTYSLMKYIIKKGLLQ